MTHYDGPPIDPRRHLVTAGDPPALYGVADVARIGRKGNERAASYDYRK